MKLIKIIKSQKLTIIGAVAGLIGGYLYWRFVGCSSGSCPITSQPVNSSIYGAILGGLLFSSFKPKKSKGKDKS